MPVLVVGADTEAGLAILDGLNDPNREVRAFVTDEDVGARLKGKGIKVAVGDVSDDSHVEAAATACFSAVLIAEAAHDERERSFAAVPGEVLAGWGRAMTGSGVARVIWVSSAEPPASSGHERATVDPADPDLVARVVALDEAESIQ